MTNPLSTILRSKTKTVEISRSLPTVMIGERINPTGRKKVQEALAAGKYDIVRKDAIEQVRAGAQVLDINAGVPGLDERALLTAIMQEVMAVVDVPLCIDTANPEALEAALKLYEGKPLINSVNGERRSLQTVLPLAKAYHAAVIGLCMDDNGIPRTAEGRLSAAAKIIQQATQMGIPIEDIVIDPLAMALSADSQSARIALQTIELVVKEFGVNITVGASNISYGMPDRPYLNSAFIAMAIHAGLTCPITNPLVVENTTAILAGDLARGKDEDGMRWIRAYRQRQRAAAGAAAD